VLSLVEQIKAAYDSFSEASAQLVVSHKRALLKERQRGETALQEHGKVCAAAATEARNLYERQKTTLQAHYLSRKARISRAFQSSKEQRLKEIEDRSGARKYELQKLLLKAERDRDADLAAATQEFEQYRQELTAQEQRLAALEGSVQASIAGYSVLRTRFLRIYEDSCVRADQDHHVALEEMKRLIGSTQAKADRLRDLVWLRLVRYWWIWGVFLLPLGAAPALVSISVLENRGVTWMHTLGGVSAAWIFLLTLRYVAQRHALPIVVAIGTDLAKARRTCESGMQQSEAHYYAARDKAQTAFDSTAQTSEVELKKLTTEAGHVRVAVRRSADERTVSIAARHEELSRASLARFEEDYAVAGEALLRSESEGKKAILEAQDSVARRLEASMAAEQERLRREWQAATGALLAVLEEMSQEASRIFPPWDAMIRDDWHPPVEFAGAVRFATAWLSLSGLSQSVPSGVFPVAPQGPLEIPLCLTFPREGSILFETKNTGQHQVIDALNAIILRLLCGSPPGRLNFTIFDPVGLGQNFAGVMHLADYEEQIINSRIWTQSGQIEQKLADLNEHMEKVIQMYLRNEYEDLEQYNRQAGVIAEKLHFLVVADFPSGFTDTAARRLLSIAASGARCGVYTLIHWDQRQALPQGFLPDELRKSSICLAVGAEGAVLLPRKLPGAELVLEAAPTPDVATELVHRIGRLSRDSSRVEVPFDQVTPASEKIWTQKTEKELRVPIGRTGATKLQYLEIGKGTCQHGLIVGKTGSGKSTLLHVIITNLSLWCSPDEVEFYLVDFKKGVEFKCYATRKLPHAKVVAIESDREFGLSVLQRVDDELRRRGDLFRQMGVQDLAGYKRVGGTEPIPRSLLIIDEFQEFFVEDDRIAQNASLLLDRIVRQGRAFGIHVLLGSQTLGGAYTMARTTLGQMVIRIALQCNEADSYLIMDDSNPAPRLLSRPGEAIYNDAAGALAGNSPFQVVWLPDEVRDDYLARVQAHAAAVAPGHSEPIVFEGNAPADVRENSVLQKTLTAKSLRLSPTVRFWLGAPNSIKGPTEAVIQRQSGSNLLVVGQRDEAILALMVINLIALAGQHPVGGVQFILCETTAPGSAQREFLDYVLSMIPHPVERLKQNDLPACFQELGAELDARAGDPEGENKPSRFIFIHGIQKFPKLRYEDDFSFSSDANNANPGAVLNRLICEGARLGFHSIITCDTYNNTTRFLSRKAISELEMRLLFQMSANDSASLIDNPKACQLGMHRALFYNSQESHLETFRPYALPDRHWVQEAGEHLKRLLRTPPTP